MAGDIFISETKQWMKAGWAFRGVMRAASSHIPDSMPRLRALIDERVEGWNFVNLETECSRAEVRALLCALREGYKDTELAGSSSFGDPSSFASYTSAFSQLIHMIEEDLESEDERNSDVPEADTHG
jgi:hypothetical protein